MSFAEMGREDWYRRTSWTTDDQSDFFGRLKRARGTYSKAQYLRIQALYLQQSGLYAEAVRLLNLLQAEYAEETQATAAFLQKAECLWSIGDRPGAFDAYVEALAAQRRYPNSISLVALSFAENFHDFDAGSYRQMLLKELEAEIERLSVLDALSRVRYGRVFARLFAGLGDEEQARKWESIAQDAQRQYTVESIPVVQEQPQPAAQADGNTQTVSRKSDLAKQVDKIQRDLRPMLQKRGFRLRGRTFNRHTPDGLTHVINIEMGRFDPPGATYIPGLTRSTYGELRINCGVYVPEVAEYTLGVRNKAFVREYDCCIRATIGELLPQQRDLWWRIDERGGLVEELRDHLERYILPFLDAFQARDAVLQRAADVWRGGCAPPRITCAIILARRGQADEARRLLEAQAREHGSHGHDAYVRELAHRLGLGDLSA